MCLRLEVLEESRVEKADENFKQRGQKIENFWGWRLRFKGCW
jgi:hypothetical protein